MFGNKEKKEQRFRVVVKEAMNGGGDGVMCVYLDTETGIQYVHVAGNYEGGMTVLLGADGKPLINEEYKQK